MTDLKKWFPFKFRRNKPTEASGSSDGGGGKTAEKSQVPARTSQASMSPGLLFPAFSPEMGRLMERMFSEPFFSRPFPSLGEMDRFFGDFAPSTFSPSVDLVDEGSHLVVTAELPGLGKDDIELSVQENMLSLRGQKKHEERKDEDGCYRTERYFGSFQRTIPLPADVDLEKVEANFDKGVLTVRFPKTHPTAEPEQSRKIPVS
jgi:HSP20 family protein